MQKYDVNLSIPSPNTPKSPANSRFARLFCCPEKGIFQSGDGSMMEGLFNEVVLRPNEVTRFVRS